MPTIPALKPRRGTKTVMETKNIILAKGELFLEIPEDGVGTGAGRIKMGDGVTEYSNLPYFDAADIQIATTTEAGKVKPDGETITIDSDGTIHGAAQGGVYSDLDSTSEDEVDPIESASATLSKSYAVGGTGSRSGEDIDNAKYYYERCAASLAQVAALLNGSEFDVDEDGNLIYSSNGTYVFSIDDDGKLIWNYNGKNLPNISLSENDMLNAAYLSSQQNSVAITQIKDQTKVFNNVIVPTTAWTEDTTFSDYGYIASITCNGVTSDFFVDVVFNPIDASSGNFAPVAKTGTDTVTIYAKEIPSEEITILSIRCVR